MLQLGPQVRWNLHPHALDVAARVIRVERPGIPVILATGYAELPSGVGAGLLKLSKPFRQQELMQAVASAVPV